MAELGEGLSGYLDVQDATLRAPRIEAVSNIGISNTAPQHAFSVGSNLYVSTDSSNVLTVDGNVVCEGVKVGLIEIIPSYDFAAVSNVGNVTQSTIQFSNATTAFVTTANIEVGTANLFVDTVTGRVGIGKTDPGGPLDVVASSEGDYIARFKNSGTSGDEDARIVIETSDADGEARILFQTTDESTTHKWNIGPGSGITPALFFQYDSDFNAGTTAMTIDHGGNVGIGTTNPSATLEVDGSSKFKAILYVSPGDNSYNSYTSTVGNSSRFVIMEHATFDGDIGGNHPLPECGTIMTNRSSSGTFPWIMYTGIVKDVASSVQETIRMDFGGGTATTLENPTLNPYMSIRNGTGNVGIGITDPTGFEVYNKTINQKYRDDFTNIHVNNKYQIDGRDGAAPNTLSQRYGVRAADNAGLNPNNAELILGAYADQNDTGADGGFISFNDSHNFHITKHPDANYGEDVVQNTNTNIPYIGSDPNNQLIPLMTIQPDGNVGIGVNSPQAKLEISSTAQSSSDSTNNVNQLRINCTNSLSYAGTGGGITFCQRYWSDSGTMISTGGIFGGRLGGTNGSYGGGLVFKYNPGAAMVVGMVLDKNGDVGIGDTTPSYKLDVNGTLRCFGFTNSSSDDRIKYNEQNVSNALTLISQLNPQKYEKIMERPNPYEGTWIPTDEEWENVKGDYKHGDEFGFIAQDVRGIPELAFLVNGEEMRTDTKTLTPEEYSNLVSEEQSTYTTSYIYESNVITQVEYSNLTPEEQGLYYTQYTKQIETQTPLALNYQGLFVVAIGAIQELKVKNDTLEAQVANLLERVTALESI